MKKLYATLLATVVAVGTAFAAQYKISPINTSIKKNLTLEEVVSADVTVNGTVITYDKNLRKNGVQGVTRATGYEGMWYTLGAVSPMDETANYDLEAEGEIYITAGSSADEVMIYGLLPSMPYGLVATIEGGNIVLEQQVVAYDDYNGCNIVFSNVNSNGQITTDPIKIEVVEQQDYTLLLFPDDDTNYLMAVVPEGYDGAYSVFYYFEGQYAVEGTYHYLGTAGFMDNQVAPWFFDEDAVLTDILPEAEVAILQEEGTSKYAVLQPFSYLTYSINFGLFSSLVLDCTDPDYVTYEPSFLWPVPSKEGNYYFISSFSYVLGNMVAEAVDRDEFVTGSEYAESQITLENGTVTFDKYSSCLLDMNLQSGLGSLYDPTGLANAFESQISLPASGIESIGAVDNNNAPVELFNIQGQRVITPAAGQLVIRRQGTDVQKYIAR